MFINSLVVSQLIDEVQWHPVLLSMLAETEVFESINNETISSFIIIIILSSSVAFCSY